jgi:hypothetical protein
MSTITITNNFIVDKVCRTEDDELYIKISSNDNVVVEIKIPKKIMLQLSQKEIKANI